MSSFILLQAGWLDMWAGSKGGHAFIIHPCIQKTYTENWLHRKDSTIGAEGQPKMKQIWLVPTSWDQVSRREDRRRINIWCKKKMLIVVRGTMFSDEEEGRRTRDEFQKLCHEACRMDNI